MRWFTRPIFWIFFGIAGFGVFLLLQLHSCQNWDAVQKSWPLILVGLGALQWSDSDFRDLTSAFALISLGAVLFLINHRVLTFHLIWQFWLVFLKFVLSKIVIFL
ncbi:MAG: hypothetical protein ACE5HO_20875 [bacterium]